MKEFIRQLIQKYFMFISRKNRSAVLFFLHYNRTVSVLIKDAIKNDCRIVFLPTRKKFFDKHNNDFNFNWKDVTDVDLILMGYISGYISDDIKKFVEKNSRGIKRFFVVDRLTRNNLYYHLLLFWFNNDEKTKTVYLDHGDVGTIHGYIEYDRFINYDYYYVPTDEMKQHIDIVFDQFKIRFDKEIKVGIWNMPRPKIKKKKTEKINIVFAPQFPTGDRFPQEYPELIRYEHRKKIIDVLSEKTFFYYKENIFNKYYNVIYKGYTNGDDEYDAFIEYLKAKDEVKIVLNNSFDKLLEKTTALFTDCISTTMFNAIHNGIPVFCFRWRKAAPPQKLIVEKYYQFIYLFDDLNELELQVNAVINNIVMGNIPEIPKLKCSSTKLPWQ